MADLFGRDWRIEVEGTGALIDVSELDIAFQTMRSTRSEPNTATVVIFNLAATTRARITDRLAAGVRAAAQARQEAADAAAAAQNDLTIGPERARQLNQIAADAAARAGSSLPLVKVYAGYKSTGASLIFAGQAREVTTQREGLESILTVECADRGIQYQHARINRSFPAGTRVSVALEACVDALDIGKGNLDDFLADMRLSNGATEFSSGYVASGPAHREVTRILHGMATDARGAGLRWTVQNGVFTILRRGQPVQTRATVLGPNSGLLGSPTAGERGEVSCKSLIQPGLDPGRVVTLESRDLSGSYTVAVNKSKGDTRGDTWDAELVLKPY